MADSLTSCSAGEVGGGWLRASRLIRIRALEARRLALLIEAYDEACVATVEVTAAARKKRVFNPHHESIAERGRLIRAVVELGYRGGRSRSSGGKVSASAHQVLEQLDCCNVSGREMGGWVVPR